MKILIINDIGKDEIVFVDAFDLYTEKVVDKIQKFLLENISASVFEKLIFKLKCGGYIYDKMQ